MRILITGTTYYPFLNGQAVFTTNLAERLVEKGHKVLVVYPSEKGTAFQAEQHGVQLDAIHSLSLSQWHENGFFTPFPNQDVRRILDAFQPEIVHIQDHYMLSRSFVLSARRRGIKTMGTNHFMPENLAAYIPLISRFKPLYNRLAWKWLMEVYNRLDVVVAQSKASAGMLRAEGLRPPIELISCGIDLKRFQPNPGLDRAAIRQRFGISTEKTGFLFVGRVDPEKRLDVLLRAISLIDRDDIQLVIAGHGSASNRLESLARELNLNERIRFTGFVANEDLPALINSMDVFTMPSEAELLSIASLEAMACARPLLLANAIALPELVIPGENGYLFQPNNPQDAARYMNRLAEEKERWPAMGQVSLTQAQDHGMETVIRKYENLYQKLLAQNL